MSLFGSSMGDFEDDPFFGSHMQSLHRMTNMMNSMNSMFADPFGLMAPPAIMGPGNPQSRMGQIPGMQMMPFGFPPMPTISMGRIFSDLQNMGQNPNCQSFTSSSIMTMTSGPDGQPQVYQESMSTRTAPGGIKETKQTVRDSRTGTRKMAIGHHIGDRAHILEREQNMHNGDQEERQEFINLDEEEAESFNHEWETKTKRSMSVTAGPSHRSHTPYNRGQENRQLALPSSVPPSNRLFRHPSKTLALPRRAIRSIKLRSKVNSNTTLRSSESNSSSAGATVKSCNNSSRNDSNSNYNDSINSNTDVIASSIDSKVQEAPENLSSSTRKRDHSPEPEILYSSNKRRSNLQTVNKD